MYILGPEKYEELLGKQNSKIYFYRFIKFFLALFLGLNVHGYIMYKQCEKILSKIDPHSDAHTIENLFKNATDSTYLLNKFIEDAHNFFKKK